MTQVADKKKISSGEMKRFLEFSLANEKYAIPLLAVKEVIAVPDVTPIPFSPTHFLGIMNLRGQVISVVDLRTKLGIKVQNSTETAVIICDLGVVNLGVVVNSVDSVLTLSESEINSKPEIQNSKSSQYIIGVTEKNKKLILILDIAKALDVSDLNTIKKAEGKAA